MCKGKNKRLGTGSHFFSKVAPSSQGLCRNREPLFVNREPLSSNQIYSILVFQRKSWALSRRYGKISVAQANHFESEWAPLKGFWVRNSACRPLNFSLVYVPVLLKSQPIKSKQFILTKSLPQVGCKSKLNTY